jgi:hypothetical protein
VPEAALDPSPSTSLPLLLAIVIVLRGFHF